MRHHKAENIIARTKQFVRLNNLCLYSPTFASTSVTFPLCANSRKHQIRSFFFNNALLKTQKRFTTSDSNERNRSVSSGDNRSGSSRREVEESSVATIWTTGSRSMHESIYPETKLEPPQGWRAKYDFEELIPDSEKAKEERDKDWEIILDDMFTEEDQLKQIRFETKITKTIKDFVREELKTELTQEHKRFFNECIYPNYGETADKRKDFLYIAPLSELEEMYKKFFVFAFEYLLFSCDSERLTKAPGFRMIVLTYSRERAVYLNNFFQKYTKRFEEVFSTFHSFATVNGRSVSNEQSYIDHRLPEILVATPDRLETHLKFSDYTNNTKFIVLDMGDKTLDLYTEPIKKIVEQCPKDIMTAYISDKGCDNISEFGLMKHDEKITFTLPTDSLYNPKCKQIYVPCSDRFDLLRTVYSISKNNRDKKVAVFCSNGKQAALYHHLFSQVGLYTFLIKSGMDPSLRSTFFHKYCGIKNGILLTTDVVSQTITDDVDIIVNVGKFNPRDFNTRLSRTVKSDIAQSIFLLLPEEESILSELGIDAERATDLTAYKNYADELPQEKIDLIAQSHDICIFNDELYGEPILPKSRKILRALATKKTEIYKKRKEKKNRK